MDKDMQQYLDKAEVLIEALPYIQKFNRKIIVVKYGGSAMTNEIITLVKDTSLAFSLAYLEMFTIAKQIAARETTFAPFVVAAVFYYIFNLLVAFVMKKLEKKMNYYN